MILDTWQQKMTSDKGYHELSLQAQHLFTQDSIEDKVPTSLVQHIVRKMHRHE